MEALQLYKFIQDNNIEWHRNENDGKDDVIIFVMIYQIKEFKELLSSTILDEGGIECRMLDGYFAFWMNDICDHYGIDMNKVFDGSGW